MIMLAGTSYRSYARGRANAQTAVERAQQTPSRADHGQRMRRLIDELRTHPWHYALPLAALCVLISALVALRPNAPVAPTVAPAPAAAPVEPTDQPLTGADRAWLRDEA